MTMLDDLDSFKKGDIITFVDNLPNLKEFELKENNIDLNDIKNKEIKKKVKEKINLINY